MANGSNTNLWRSLYKGMTALRGSLICMFVIVLYDVALTGSYVFAVLVCPIWFLVAVILEFVQPPTWKVAIAQVLMPIVTLAIVLANSSLQGRIARANSERLIKVCERYRADHGDYPERLDQLVPDYVSAVPRAKYCCAFGAFSYWNFEGPNAFFWWVELPPYGRRTYDLDSKKWGYID